MRLVHTIACRGRLQFGLLGQRAAATLVGAVPMLTLIETELAAQVRRLRDIRDLVV